MNAYRIVIKLGTPREDQNYDIWLLKADDEKHAVELAQHKFPDDEIEDVMLLSTDPDVELANYQEGGEGIDSEPCS